MDETFEAQIEIARSAATRWKERKNERTENIKTLREKGVEAVEDPDRIAKHRDHVAALGMPRHGAIPDGRIERIIGVDDRRKFFITEDEEKAGKPVARIVKVHGEGMQPQGFGSGFMVTENLLMTNNHVLAGKRTTNNTAANFGHDFVPGGGIRTGEIFEFDADRFFVTNEALDYTIVAVKPRSHSGAALSAQGFHSLLQQTGKILIGQPVNVIQHPMGGPKQYATAGNELVDLLDDFLHYKTDTEPGASGSPVFSALWQTVALHHSGVPAMKDGDILDVNGNVWDENDWDDVLWVSNEGVRISRILNHLANVVLDVPAQAALRDDLIAGSKATPAAEKAPDTAVAKVVTTASTGGAQAPVSDTSAQTVVHVHGDAEVYTGTVVQEAPAAPATLGTVESAPALALEKVIEFDPHYGRRRGYSPHFLRGHLIEMPSIEKKRLKELHADRFGNPLVLDYHHYSLVMNTEWLMMMWSAVNVDYSPEVRWDLTRADFGRDKWIHDPRLSEALQIDNEELYKPAKKFDRGHVVRREDSAWGVTQEEVIYANSDTFHWTNCTPQHENFNRSNKTGVWGKLENHIAKETETADGRVILFSGPVLNKKRAIPHDFGGGLFRVPMDFWKVVVVAGPGDGGKTDLLSYGFLLQQETAIKDHGLEALPEERFDVGEFAPQQRSLKALEDLAGIVFPENVMKADVMKQAEDDSSIPLDGLESIKLD